MSSLKKEITFEEFWEPLKKEARRRGWRIGYFMERCKIPRQRYSEFDKGERALTGNYINRIMEGLGLTQEQVEGIAGKKFSPEQIKERKIESWAAAHRDIIVAMLDDYDLVPIVRAICEKRSK